MASYDPIIGDVVPLANCRRDLGAPTDFTLRQWAPTLTARLIRAAAVARRTRCLPTGLRHNILLGKALPMGIYGAEAGHAADSAVARPQVPRQGLGDVVPPPPAPLSEGRVSRRTDCFTAGAEDSRLGARPSSSQRTSRRSVLFLVM